MKRHYPSSITIVVFPIVLHLIFTLPAAQRTLAQEPPCRTKCGPLDIKYPLGTGHGCGSPRFHPYVTCASSYDGGRLLLTTHTGSYPITSISYATSTLIITPHSMSNCTAMLPSTSNLGLDWAGPFQLGPSTFILLSCPPPTSALAVKGAAICDPSTLYLCASIYTCPAVVGLGLPLFPPTNTCCVYAPANLNPKGELDLAGLNCAGYASVVDLGDVPTDPSRWKYGVELKYTEGGKDGYNMSPNCLGCEMSNGVCGYAPPSNSFVCVCRGYNTSKDCYNYNPDEGMFLSSSHRSIYEFSLSLFLSLSLCI